MAVILYGPFQVRASFLALAFLMFPTTFRSTKSPVLNSLIFTSLLYCQASFCWYSASRIVIDSLHSSNRSSNFTINSLFLVGINPKTRALHKFTLASMTTSTSYVRENGVSPLDLLGVVRYAQKTLDSSSAHLPLTPPSFSLICLQLLCWWL